MKTFTVGRQIEVFDIKTDLLVKEIEIDSFDLDLMKTKFRIKKDDPLMYDPYEINPSNSDLFAGIDFDFQKFSYYVAAYQKPINKD
jgi:hypothetical protein